MRRAPSADLKRSRKRSTTGSTTMKRLAAMQLWPLLISRASAAARAAASTSASANTMKGSLPPSSRTVFFSMRPACSATAMPARSLPVSVAATMRGSAMISFTPAGFVSTVWKSPSGKPARRKTCSISSAQRGTLEACLRIPPLPAMRAGAAKRKTCQYGKFHGITASTTPSGSKRT